MQIRAEEISAILKERIEEFERGVELAEEGIVTYVGDRIARVYGLDNVMYSELVEFPHGVMGMAFNLEEDSVGIVILGEDVYIKEGDRVKRTKRIVQVPVGESLIGRVVNPLGQPIDGLGPIEATEFAPVERLARALGVPVFRGSIDPLTRFFEVTSVFRPCHVVRLKADCPALPPEVLDEAIELHLDSGADYTTNTWKRRFPVGYDVEILSRETLFHLHHYTRSPLEREHITLYLERHPQDLHIVHQVYSRDLSSLRLTLDYPGDYRVLSALFEALYPRNPLFGLEEVEEFLEARPELKALNAHIPPHAGILKDAARFKDFPTAKPLSELN